MRAVLICPTPRLGVQLLSQNAPLAVSPLLGQGLVEYWLSHLAAEGVKDVLVLSDDRPEQIRPVVGAGERWGLKVTVVEEQREVTEVEAAARYNRRATENPNLGMECVADKPAPDTEIDRVVLMDYFPVLPEYPLFSSYEQWFAALFKWIPRAKTPDRVGVLEYSSDVLTGLHTHVSGKAQINGPCWIGKNVYIGARAVIGPNTIIEDGVFIEPGAMIKGSVIGKDTFVGQFANIEGSLALGDTLIHLASGSQTQIPDRFLLCALRHSRSSQRAGVFSRISELCNTEAQWIWKNLLLNRES